MTMAEIRIAMQDQCKETQSLRSQLARKDEEAELYRRQYDELSAWWRGERPDEEYVGNGHPLEERHARERAALREPAPVASHDASDTIRNARSVSHDNREPDGRKGEPECCDECRAAQQRLGAGCAKNCDEAQQAKCAEGAE